MTKQKNEIIKIRQEIIKAIPTGVDKISIIIALAELQKTFAELILEDDPEPIATNNALTFNPECTCKIWFSAPHKDHEETCPWYGVGEIR